MSPLLRQHLPVVDEASLQLLTVEEPVDHLEVGGAGRRSPPGPVPRRVSVRGRAERLCTSVVRVVGAIASHFNELGYRLHVSGVQGLPPGTNLHRGVWGRAEPGFRAVPPPPSRHAPHVGPGERGDRTAVPPETTTETLLSTTLEA